MAVVWIDSDLISDWTSFHLVCREAFGFPSFYGMNLNAFIDCLTYIDEGDGMSNIVLEGDETLTIELHESGKFRSRLPEIFEALSDAIEAINQRSLDDGKQPRITMELA